MTITPRYDLSLDFLRRFHPGRRWLLTAIGQDRKGIETRTFAEATVPEMMQWLDRIGATHNLYFSVGEPLADFSKKAERTDMARVWWFHVDVDPRAGEDIGMEQQRSLGLLQRPPAPLPPPTVVVFSGGGHQGFWKLREPIEINGSEAAAEDAKRYNLAIELALGADNVHDISRIMRLPGSVNRPDEKKRKKGRVESLAAVVEWHKDRVYDLSAFQKAPQVQTGTATGFPASSVKVSGNIRRFNSVDELPDKVTVRTRVIIAQGVDPDEPNKHPSRSEWLFGVLCEMVRADCTDDDMFSVITDPKFGISASVLDKGSNSERYALKQIEKAREHAVDPDLRLMNEKHAVIGNWGGQCRVVEEVWDDGLKRHRLTRSTFEDIRNRYMHQLKRCGTNPNTGDVILKPMGQWWLGHEKRRQYNSLIFSPGKEVPGAYNLWRGFACEARPGSCELFLSHLRDVLCRGEEELYSYLLGWMANTVQNLDSPGFSAVVFRGGMGTGKSIVAKIFGSLFGRHYMSVTDPKHLVGNFNHHLRDVILLFGEEAFYAGDKKHESILKTLITEETITIEKKGVDAETCPNYVHLMMASNEQWVVPARVDDRRFFVLDVSDQHKEDHRYFSAMMDQMNTGGREALLHTLLNHDLRKFNVRQVPKTGALQEQKLHSLDVESEWWYTKLREGRVLPHHSTWVREIHTLDLVADFQSYTRGYGIGKRSNQTRLDMMIRKVCPPVKGPEPRNTPVRTIDQVTGKEVTVARPFFWVFPGLAEARKAWDREFGGPHRWPEVSMEEQGVLQGEMDEPF